MEDHARGVSRLGMAAAVVAATTAALTACSAGSPRRSEPLSGPLVITEPAQSHGRVVYMQDCYKCHPGGEAGIGPSLNNRRFTTALMRMRIRRGGERMPAFDRSKISDKQMDELMAYLSALRRHSERIDEPFEAQEASR